MDILYWTSLAAIISAGGFMRGFSGFGTTLVMVPLLSLLMLPSQAVFLALSIDVIVIIPILPKAIKQAEWKPIVPLVVGSLAAIPLGAWILVMASPGTMRIVISVMVLTSALLLLNGWSYRGEKTKLLSFVVGIFSGIANGATAIGGPPIAVYFIAKGMPPVVFRASLNVVAFIMQGLSVIAIYSMGSFEMSNTVRIFTLAPLMFIFVWFGSIIFKLVDNRLFNRLMLYFLISFAAYILIITIYNT
jgi:uncharacterized membrane protein YfcA|tara:strand:+ start:292 stop:1029 length:738 start_codon:yes stop_codon:yes gene_type:complete